MERSELIKEIAELQRSINRDMRNNRLGAWMELNLTVPQVKSMFFIANAGTTNHTKLAAALGVTPANVTGIIDRLVEQGLVSRQENLDDRRSTTLRVTEKGENTIANLHERRSSYTAEILSNLKTEDLNTIFQGFNLFYQATRDFSEKQKDIQPRYSKQGQFFKRHQL